MSTIQKTFSHAITTDGGGRIYDAPFSEKVEYVGEIPIWRGVILATSNLKPMNFYDSLQAPASIFVRHISGDGPALFFTDGTLSAALAPGQIACLTYPESDFFVKASFNETIRILATVHGGEQQESGWFVITDENGSALVDENGDGIGGIDF